MASGDLSDDEAAQVLKQYNEYLGTLDQRSAAWRFATTISLNDAYLDRVLSDRSKGSLRLTLLTGDKQVGYWMTELHYSGAEIAAGEEILKLGLSKRPSEVWHVRKLRLHSRANSDQAASNVYRPVGLGLSSLGSLIPSVPRTPDGALGKQRRSRSVSAPARRSGSARWQGSAPARRPDPGHLCHL
jgi:hypothetical protein